MSRIDEYASRAYYERRGALLGEDPPEETCPVGGGEHVPYFGTDCALCGLNEDPYDEVIADPPGRDE